MKKISLVIGGKRYTITLEEPFAEAVEQELTELFDPAKDNETKTLLQAFLTKQIECLELEEKLNELLKKFPD
ncbi:hypothetical protein [Hydrogenimonas cancrithermarum]|uniref:Cell division protein ZapA n=1 Tax=Hydrogenimonas cancrithermarum TaxID=2993563 RepID=A0ABM8FMJ0_9BACT|nr:hypothetical protein [Hydrogenimonas cancrithermarum]BDY12672.1 hypothetical protein HCR_09840 [Hydrogenimonas cancrithermarum]